MNPGQQTALILNANAKHVTARRAQQLARLCNADDVYVSRSLEEAEQVAQMVVEKGYGRVLSGGGDGTLVCVLNHIFSALDKMENGQTPQVGVLKLGTGNAVASILGAARPEDDLLKLINEPNLATVPLGLINSPQDDLDFPFAGIGYDGEILNDYLWIKEHLRGPFVEEITHSVLGYFFAIFGRTVPRKMKEPVPPSVRITSRGKASFRDPTQGDALCDVPAGSVLYEGPAALVSVGTVPFYGFNFRMFPFAQDVPGMMQLRVCAASPFALIRNLPSVWRGEFRDPDLLDFHVEDIVIESERPVPYQIGGDARGTRKRLEFVMSHRQVELVTPHQGDLQRAA